MKRKHIIALCALTAAAVLGAAAGTGAYLTHRTAETVNTFAVGRLEAELTEPEWDKLPDEAKVLYPGKTVAKDPTACNAAESTTAAYMYLQVEIPRASVRTYTIEDINKTAEANETTAENDPNSGAGVLDNNGEPHTVDLVSFQPNDGWSLLEETETEETHTFIYVALFPQGYAALLTDPDLLLDEPSLLLMDIGGWTVDLMRIDNARPVAETAHSLEFGMIRCIDAVREQVRRETGLSLTDAQIEQMLAGGPCALGDSVREIVRQQGRAYTERLFALVTEAGFDLRALPTVMLGGGAGIVQRHVGPKDGLCRAMFLPDDKVNAVGFERALAQLSGRVSEG